MQWRSYFMAHRRQEFALRAVRRLGLLLSRFRGLPSIPQVLLRPATVSEINETRRSCDEHRQDDAPEEPENDGLRARRLLADLGRQPLDVPAFDGQRFVNGATNLGHVLLPTPLGDDLSGGRRAALLIRRDRS